MITENLVKSDLFQNVELEYINNLVQKSQTIHLDENEFLFHQGEMGKGMYIIAEGGVDVVLESGEKEKVIAKLGRDEFFGEVCMLKPQERTAAVRSNAKTRLLYIDNKNFQRHIDENNPNALRISFNIAQTLVDRLKNANDILAHLKEDEEGGQSGGSDATKREVDQFKKQLLEEGYF